MTRFCAALLLAVISLPCIAEPKWKVRPNEHECAYHTSGGCGLTVQDEVNAFGCEEDGYYFNFHRLFFSANTRLTITGTSTAFRPFMAIFDDATNDPAFGSVSATGTTATLVVDIPRAGYYVIGIGGQDRVDLGRYSLSISCTAIPSNPGACVPNATTACLLNDRFRVSISYVNPFSNPPNQPGTFLAARLLQGAQNPDVALFGFSSAQAVEVVVRIQDTRPFAPRFDVYYGGLTDVAYTVMVTDTVTGSSRQYVNPAGRVGGGVDRTTFPAN